jgi:hypothetical protein
MIKMNSVLAVAALSLVSAASQAHVWSIDANSTSITSGTGDATGTSTIFASGTFDNVLGTAQWTTTSLAQTYIGGGALLATEAFITTDNVFQFTSATTGILSQTTTACTETATTVFFGTCDANPPGTISFYGAGFPNLNISDIDASGPITFTTSGTFGGGQVVVNTCFSLSLITALTLDGEEHIAPLGACETYGQYDGYGVDGTGLVSTVPIPAAAWLFGTALLGLVGVKRKK